MVSRYAQFIIYFNLYLCGLILIFFDSQLLKPKLVRRNYESACVVSRLNFHCVINFTVVKVVKM